MGRVGGFEDSSGLLLGIKKRDDPAWRGQEPSAALERHLCCWRRCPRDAALGRFAPYFDAIAGFTQLLLRALEERDLEIRRKGQTAAVNDISPEPWVMLL